MEQAVTGRHAAPAQIPSTRRFVENQTGRLTARCSSVLVTRKPRADYAQPPHTTTLNVRTADSPAVDGHFHNPRRCKTSSVGQSVGLLIPRSSVQSRQNPQKPRTRIHMDWNYIDLQARVLNYWFKSNSGVGKSIEKLTRQMHWRSKSDTLVLEPSVLSRKRSMRRLFPWRATTQPHPVDPASIHNHCDTGSPGPVGYDEFTEFLYQFLPCGVSHSGILSYEIDSDTAT